MSPPLRWSDEQLQEGLRRSAEDFRVLRLEEEPGAYTTAFDDYWAIIHDLFATTVDLTEWEDVALQVLTDKELFVAFRYLMGPPISLDDLKTIADTNTFNRKSLRDDPGLVERIIQIVRDAIDRRRFPWVNERLEATEPEKNAAVLATAALMATRRIETQRRNEAKTEQEMRVDGALSGVGFIRVPRRKIRTFTDAPLPGQFCSESVLGRRKADFTVGLWDRRVMAIECKVSNSATNSVKRLNNDAAAKAKAWHDSFGQDQVVPTAVLSGVYKLHNLQDAQDRGLTLFWAHDLKSLLGWIEGTKS
jgi:XamI restriction endonuclease